MMELDELKKELNARMSQDRQRSEADISSLLKSDTVSVLHKLKKSLQLEITLSVVFALLCSYMIFFSNSWQYRVLFSILGIVSVGFIAVLYFLLKKTEITISSATIRENLEKLTIIIEGYSKRYIQLLLFFLPLCFALGVWLSYKDPDNALRPLTAETILLLAGAMLVLGVIVYVFTKWYMKKLYRNYIEQLKVSLKELEDE